MRTLTITITRKIYGANVQISLAGLYIDGWNAFRAYATNCNMQLVV